MKIATAIFLLISVAHYQLATSGDSDDENDVLWNGTVRLTKGAEFSFMASISLKNHGYDPSFPVQVCSGVLLTRRHVITSAHCINEVNDLHDVRVKLGFKDSTFTAKYGIKAWTTYELWAKDNGIVPEPLEHDISILKLEEKAEQIIRPAKITNRSNDFFDGKQVKTVVWGPHKKYKSVMLLRVAQLNVISHNDCMKELNASPLLLRNHTIDKTYICTKINLGAVLDDIDSGTPLLISDNELIAINDPTYLRRHGIHAPTNLNFHVGLEYYKTFIKNVTESKSGKWWRWSRN